MSRINSTAAEALVDFSVETVDFDLEKEEVATDLVQELGIEQQVQDDLQKNLDATQLYLGEIGF
ncbi:MAG TPA: RNA polymerase sigma factor RpoS, partial [Shewanella sp.]|nr:RNA polymerase sigma factor RpoS [Shewanella sp.]